VRAIRLSTSLLIGVLLIGASVAPAAVATIATTASLSMVSEEGDWVGSGLSYSYSTETGDTVDSNSAGRTDNAGIVVLGANGDWWNLIFSAPDGQTLVPGTYSGHKVPFQRPWRTGPVNHWQQPRVQHSVGKLHGSRRLLWPI
jgi:hypothetical protein